eukprot:TRINITY_DN2153_c0_g1_i3.p1 TRINITY_DN2153_c0_g1~~TRINITY_DN2153_c0_g1_i3.p1  ORF type:complete len:410 (-),score=46.39 TRINITY_DN2153_c0_g1_i3:129-1358(-)
MLTIKRVPTVVSNYQEEGSETLGCGRNCLGKCCLPVAKLPLYSFKREGEAIKGVVSESEDPQFSFLNTLLLGQWEDRMSRGLFRYDVMTCETKVIPGNHGFIAQLNEGRHLKKRPTEFRVDRVLQPFDGKKFNFTKVGQEEVLLRFEQSKDEKIHYIHSAPITDTEAPSVIAINVSPIEYGHVLLIPQVLDCLPQRIDHESFLLALHMAAEAGSPFFRLGYNSLGAFATINHLHFQAYYLAVPFPVEKAPTRRIATVKGPLESGVTISRLLNYPVRGLVFEGGNTLQDLSNAVSDSCICLQDNNIPYNVLIADSGKRVFLFPQVILLLLQPHQPALLVCYSSVSLVVLSRCLDIGLYDLDADMRATLDTGTWCLTWRPKNMTYFYLHWHHKVIKLMKHLLAYLMGSPIC